MEVEYLARISETLSFVSFGIDASIRIGQEIHCLLYAVFFLFYQAKNILQKFLFKSIVLVKPLQPAFTYQLCPKRCSHISAQGHIVKTSIFNKCPRHDYNRGSGS